MRWLRQIQQQTIAVADTNEEGRTDEMGGTDGYSAQTERTDFWAGSAEKVEIMRKRLEAGEHLHHPYDCKQIIVNEQDRAAHSLILNQHERIRRRSARLTHQKKLTE